MWSAGVSFDSRFSIIYGIPKIIFIDDHNMGTLLAQVHGFFDLSTIAGIRPTRIAGIADN